MKFQLKHPRLGQAMITWTKESRRVSTDNADWKKILEDVVGLLHTNGVYITTEVADRQAHRLGFQQRRVELHDAKFPMGVHQALRLLWPEIEVSIPGDKQQQARMARARLSGLLAELKMHAADTKGLNDWMAKIQLADDQQVLELAATTFADEPAA